MAASKKVVCSTYEEALMVLETGLIERHVAGAVSKEAMQSSVFLLKQARRWYGEYICTSTLDPNLTSTFACTRYNMIQCHPYRMLVSRLTVHKNYFQDLSISKNRYARLVLIKLRTLTSLSSSIINT